MSTSQIWQTATDVGQADAVGRYIGRAGQPSGRVTRQIAYDDENGDRIVRTWADDGAMIETKVGKQDI